jgi:hypothetical protein
LKNKGDGILTIKRERERYTSKEGERRNSKVEVISKAEIEINW